MVRLLNIGCFELKFRDWTQYRWRLLFLLQVTLYIEICLRLLRLSPDVIFQMIIWINGIFIMVDELLHHLFFHLRFLKFLAYETCQTFFSWVKLICTAESELMRLLLGSIWWGLAEFMARPELAQEKRCGWCCFVSDLCSGLILTRLRATFHSEGTSSCFGWQAWLMAASSNYHLWRLFINFEFKFIQNKYIYLL